MQITQWGHYGKKYSKYGTIVPIVRSDKAAATQLFLQYLAAAGGYNGPITQLSTAFYVGAQRQTGQAGVLSGAEGTPGAIL